MVYRLDTAKCNLVLRDSAIARSSFTRNRGRVGRAVQEQNKPANYRGVANYTWCILPAPRQLILLIKRDVSQHGPRIYRHPYRHQFCDRSYLVCVSRRSGRKSDKLNDKTMWASMNSVEVPSQIFLAARSATQAPFSAPRTDLLATVPNGRVVTRSFLDYEMSREFREK
jgi:hypothetical protein